MKYETHPLAALFPLMSDKDLAELAADIKANGQLEPIVTLNGQILDGRNRYLACEIAGVEPASIEFSPVATCRSPEEYVWSMNIARRHLTPEQKREFIEKLLEADPTKSNRQIAKQAKVSHPTVAAVREEQESRGKVYHVSKTADTKGRQQPVKKPKAKREPSPVDDAALTRIANDLGIDARNDFEKGEILLTPKELKEFSQQPKKDKERIYPLLVEGMSYSEAIQEHGGKLIFLSSRLDDLAAKYNEEHGSKMDQIFEIEVDGWFFTVQRCKAEGSTKQKAREPQWV